MGRSYLLAVGVVACGLVLQSQAQVNGTVNRQARLAALEARLQAADQAAYQERLRAALAKRTERIRAAEYRLHQDRLLAAARRERAETISAARSRAALEANQRALTAIELDQRYGRSFANLEALAERRGLYGAPYRGDNRNPFAMPPAPDVADYAEPAASITEAINEGLNDAAFYADARREFREKNYQTALELVDRALAEEPYDAAMNEFRSLVLFAMQDYRRSAESLYSAVQYGPAWNYEAMIQLYSDPAIYRQQLRLLQEYSDRQEGSAEAHYLMAYHYRLGGLEELADEHFAAYRLLVQADEGIPVSAVSRPIERVPVVTRSGAVVATRFVDPNLPAQPIVAAPLLMGTWRARASGGGLYTLTLLANNEFVWYYPQGSKAPLRGVYVLDDDRIVFETDEGTAMVGMIAAAPEGLGLRVTGQGGAYLQFLK